MKQAAITYRGLAQMLSRRLASAAARNEDQQLIGSQIASARTATHAPSNATPPMPATGSSAARKR
jgi:hypothetical protein